MAESHQDRRDRDQAELVELRNRLRTDVEGLALDLLGEPSSRSGAELRFGRQGSLSVVIGRSKRGTWFSHEAGEGGDLLALIQHARSCSFPEALDFARRWVGMPEAERSTARRSAKRHKPEPANDTDDTAAKRRLAVLLAGMVRPIAGTPAERYLAGRGIAAPALPTLGWLSPLSAADHPALRDRRDAAQLSKYLRDHERFGCLLVVATDARGLPRAVQRTFLTPAGRKADLRVVKRSLASVGGAAFRIPARVGLSDREAAGVVVICEGVETGCSAWLATGLETWVMLGSLANARTVEGIDGRHVVIAADADRDGSPARKALDKTIEVVGARVATLRLARPMVDGDDWNDVHRRDGLEAVRRGIFGCKRVGGTEPALRPCYDGPAGDREFALARQKREIRAWFDGAAKIAAAHRDVDEEKRQAWADAGLKTPPRLLVSGSQGTGKTAAVLKGVASVLDPRLSVALYVPTLAKAVEAAAAYSEERSFDSPGPMVVRGRKAVDPEGDGKETMCRRADVATKAAALRVNVRQKICRTCPFQATCGYLRQDGEIREHGAGLFVMAHEYLFLPSPLTGAKIKRDLVVVDEDVALKAPAVVEFAPGRIKDSGDWTKIGLSEATAARPIADKLHRAITEQAEPLAWLRAEGITADDLKRLRKALNAQAEDVVEGIDGAMTDAEIDAVLGAVERSDLGKVARLVGQVLVEWDTGRPALSSVVYDPSARVKVGSGEDARYELQARVFVHYLRHVEVAPETPLLIVDGTGSPDLAGKLFGPMNHVRIAVERDAEVIQVSGKAFSRQSITGRRKNGEPVSDAVLEAADKLRGELGRFIRDNARGRTLVAGTKGVTDVLAGELADRPDISLGWFGALRGMNQWEHCETAVVIGREQPAMREVEAIARAFCARDREPFMSAASIPFMQDGDTMRQTRARRMRSGVSSESVVVHPDPRVQAVLEQIREAEIVQAIDRVRPVFNRRRIILLTSIPVDITVDQVRTWRELRHGGSKLDKLAAGGLVPLSAAGLHAVRPDLWGTERSAEEWLRRSPEAERLKTRTLQIDSFFRECGVLKVGQFRRTGAKSWSPVLFDPRKVRDVQAALCKLLGCDVEVQGCEVEAEPEARPAPRPAARAAPPRPVLMTGTDGPVLGAAIVEESRRPPGVFGVV
jgi:phage/plasmid primase-like uncharacterized protein